MSDDEHEEEIDLYCSSSSYDEYGSVSTDGYSSEDEDESGQQPTIEPYQYEPYVSETDSDRDGEEEPGSDSDEQAQRVGNSEWSVIISYVFLLLSCSASSW